MAPKYLRSYLSDNVKRYSGLNALDMEGVDSCKLRHVTPLTSDFQPVFP